MLKDQGQPNSLLAGQFQCHVKPFGGFTTLQLIKQLLKCQPVVKGSFDVVVVSAGTNDTHGLRFYLPDFLLGLKDLIANIYLYLDPRKIVIISLFPRTFCRQKKCEAGEKCKNIHRGELRTPLQMNTRTKSINDSILTLVKHSGNPNISFLDLFSEVWYPGGWFDLGHESTFINSKNFLADDGLHLGRAGNECLDKRLLSHLAKI